MSRAKPMREAVGVGQASALASVASALMRVFKIWSFVLIIPFIFILLRAADVRINIPQSTSMASVLEKISAGWPTLYRQYMAIEAVAASGEADRYLLFLMVTLLANTLFVIVVLSLALKIGILRFNGRDVLVVLLSVPGAVYELWFNRVKERPTIGWDFYIDGIGFYFIRESVLIHAVFLSVCMLAVVLMSACIRKA